LKAIDFDFLDNSKFERIGTKIKKASNIDDVPKVLRNIYFGPLTLKITQIIQFWCLNFFQIQF
jgi:hypothetical protein